MKKERSDTNGDDREPVQQPHSASRGARERATGASAANTQHTSRSLVLTVSQKQARDPRAASSIKQGASNKYESHPCLTVGMRTNNRARASELSDEARRSQGEALLAANLHSLSCFSCCFVCASIINRASLADDCQHFTHDSPPTSHTSLFLRLPPIVGLVLSLSSPLDPLALRSHGERVSKTSTDRRSHRVRRHTASQARTDCRSVGGGRRLRALWLSAPVTSFLDCDLHRSLHWFACRCHVQFAGCCGCSSDAKQESGRKHTRAADQDATQAAGWEVGLARGRRLEQAGCQF